MNMNRMLKGPQARQLGLADAMFEPADFLEESLLWAGRVITGETRGRAPGGLPRRGRLGRAVKAAKGLVDLKTGDGARALPRPPARHSGPHRHPRRGVRRRGRGARRPRHGRRAARRALLLRPGAEAGQAPAGAPDKSLARPVTKVGIVGAGLMASQLALLFAQRLEVPTS